MGFSSAPVKIPQRPNAFGGSGNEAILRQAAPVARNPAMPLAPLNAPAAGSAGSNPASSAFGPGAGGPIGPEGDPFGNDVTDALGNRAAGATNQALILAMGSGGVKQRFGLY